MYDDARIPMPSVTDEERGGIPDELFETERFDATDTKISTIRAQRATPERIRRMRKHYYANVTLIDEMVGAIMNTLEEKQLLDNTIVIFTSDHGDHLFDHGLYYKGELYDTVVNIPLLIRAPSLYTPGTVVDSVVSQMDVAQYILDCAGARRDDREGISLRPVIENGAVHTRRYAFAEEGATVLRRSPPVMSMIRSSEYKLIHYSGSDAGQLFDLRCDRAERSNRWEHDTYRAVRSSLTSDMLDWLYGSLHSHRSFTLHDSIEQAG
jgi:arylsulfatase A-like enzyme